MNEPADVGPADDHHSGQQHPLLADVARLQKISDNMLRTIHRTLAGCGGSPGEERVLHGGESARDVLQEALVALLRCDQADSWEAMGVTIARRRAIDALRRATRGRRRRDAADDETDQISVRPIDEVLTDYLGTPAGAWWDSPEQAYEHHAQLEVLHPLIRALPTRERTIVVEIAFNGRSRVDVGRQLNLTAQRVGQILTQTVRALLEQARRDANFSNRTTERKQP
ncbi:sigma-70 family RNA polymerase sigma factor [Mycolicibacterium sp. jd]|uniref:sigma-70 family RNA polymerase sigma factor n=1 Tax=unclassified Mycolicibacterium TaxID=2636767 RepID=UPI00351AB3BD